jgi:hypothetical protein
MNFKSFIPALMVLIPAVAFAAANNSTHVQFQNAVNVAGNQLSSGDYKLTWEGTGPDVTVSFIQGKKTVATVPATLVSAATNQPEAIETNTTNPKTIVLDAVDLKGETIRFQHSNQAAGN